MTIACFRRDRMSVFTRAIIGALRRLAPESSKDARVAGAHVPVDDPFDFSSGVRKRTPHSGGPAGGILAKHSGSRAFSARLAGWGASSVSGRAGCSAAGRDAV